MHFRTIKIPNLPKGILDISDGWNPIDLGFVFKAISNGFWPIWPSKHQFGLILRSRIQRCFRTRKIPSLPKGILAFGGYMFPQCFPSFPKYSAVFRTLAWIQAPHTGLLWRGPKKEMVSLGFWLRSTVPPSRPPPSLL